MDCSSCSAEAAFAFTPSVHPGPVGTNESSLAIHRQENPVGHGVKEIKSCRDDRTSGEKNRNDQSSRMGRRTFLFLTQIQATNRLAAFGRPFEALQ